MPSVQKQIFEKVVVTKFDNRMNDSFLQGIEDLSRHVVQVDEEAAVINRTHFTLEPGVLINNTTYPIPEEAVTDANIPISLDKYDTKNTGISDDELYAVTYDKVGETTKAHGKSLAHAHLTKAAHALGPQSNAIVPGSIIATTGTADASGRKALTKADLIAVRRAMDKKKIPQAGRRLVLCPDHYNDILEWDEKFADQWANRRTGEIFQKYGFEIVMYEDTPFYTVATLVKKSYGAVPAVGDEQASLIFYVPRIVKAKGWTKMYVSASKDDPERRKTLMGFRNFFICMPQLTDAIFAMPSGR